MAPNSSAEGILQLPISVVSRVDVGRLLREFEAIDSFLQQAAIREPGTQMKLPRTSRLFDETVELNKLNMLHEADRHRLNDFLVQVKKNAPVLHMSFSADPSPLFTQRLVTWMRAELHPLVLLQVGMQPNMGAGCVVRTTNKYFDFSLRTRFSDQGSILARLLKGAQQATPPQPKVVQ